MEDVFPPVVTEHRATESSKSVKESIVRINPYRPGTVQEMKG